MRDPAGVFVGLCTLDVVHDVERLPRANEKITARGQFVAAGGPATNAAVTFAALGGQATLVTGLGRGALADAVRAELAACRVRVVDVASDRVDAVPVSAISVLADTGERSVVSVDAADFVIEDVPDLRPLLAPTGVVLVDGHHRLLAEEASRSSAASGVPLLVDAGRWRPVMPALVPHADTVVCSADFRVPGATDSEASAVALVDGGVPTVAVTQGGDAIRWWSAGRSGRVAPPKVNAIDTVGAGDAFHGAYAYAMSAFPASIVEDRLAFAAAVASLKCCFRGTRSWLRALRETGIKRPG